eukprot:bmy_07765T0
MAVSRVCWARAALWGSAGPPGPYVARRLQFVRSGLAWGAPRSSKLHLSPKADVKSLISYVVTKTKVINGKYHRFLGRHFPRFYVLYTIFMKGLQMLWADAKKARRIKTNMWKHNIKFHQLSYREMEHLRQLTLKDASFSKYLFPRQLLIQHFWTPKQQIDFLDIYHALRKQSHPEILCYLEKVIPLISDSGLRWHMTELCTKIQRALKLGKKASLDLPNIYPSLTSPKMQRGTHPAIHDILALRECFSNHPLGMNQLHALQMVSTLRLSLFHGLTLLQVLLAVTPKSLESSNTSHTLSASCLVEIPFKDSYHCDSPTGQGFGKAGDWSADCPGGEVGKRLIAIPTCSPWWAFELTGLGASKELLVLLVTAEPRLFILSPHFYACYLRGLNSTHIAEERCRTWLGEWLQLSCSLKEAELSLLLHNVVLLSINYTGTRR